MKTYDMSLLTKKIYDSHLRLFSFQTLRDLMEIKKTSSFFKIINRLVKSGVLVKIERNKYLLKNFTDSEFFLANFIYEPSYLSFESALSFYGILSQFPYEVTSATVKQTKAKEFNGKAYSYYHLKKNLFWGYVKEENFLIAEKEKALLDQVYLASKGIKEIHLEEYDLSLLDKTKLKLYLGKYPQTRQFKMAANALLAQI